MKRTLIALVMLVGVVLFSWQYFSITPGAPGPIQMLTSWGLGTTRTASAGPAGETISSAETAAMMLDMAMLRTAVAEQYQTNGSLPRNLDDAGVTMPPHARIIKNGSIEYLAGGRPAARVYWRARPTSLGLRWDCLSPNIVNIAERLQGCQYAPAFKSDEPIRENYAYNHRLLFEFDHSDETGLSTMARSGFQQFLAQVAPNPTYHPQAVQVTGYADPMGDTRHNIQLAEERAAYVREALAALGIDRSMINMRVIGADPRPVRDCPESLPREERIQCFGASRRVDITLSGQRDI